MNRITNSSGISLPLAVWLAHDPYANGSELPEYQGRNLISVTSLLKPIRQTVLAARMDPEDQPIDILSRVKARIGQAIHTDVESTWTDDAARSQALRALGYPDQVVKGVQINPVDPDLSDFPVFMEQRRFRELKMGNFTVVISGQFDMIVESEANDFKITSTFTHTSGNKQEDYGLQGSMYRWIAPDLIKSDTLIIQHIFLDWQAAKARSQPGYPPSPVMDVPVPLMSLDETEAWIRARVREIAANQDLDQDAMARCTDKELWRTEPSYKFFSDPAKAASGGRASRVFDNMAEAQNHRAEKGKGVVITVPGQVKACGYCPAYAICNQRMEYDV